MSKEIKIAVAKEIIRMCISAIQKGTFKQQVQQCNYHSTA